MKRNLKNIAVLKGDGVGPEVINQTLKVLEAIKQKYNHDWRYHYADIGAIAIDNHGDPFPSTTYEVCVEADAVLMGAIGDPTYDNDPSAAVRPEQGLLTMRKALQLFSNVRPVRVHPKLAYMSPVKESILKDVDFVVFRELTGGIYFGEKDRGTDHASDLCMYTRAEIERVAILAYDMAQTRKQKLTLVDKANVLESSRLWRDVIQKMSHRYPDVETEYLFVDNAAMQLILNPKQFDVILTSNLFGDILSDEASVLAGSIGMLPSASRGERHALYEPVHGSYPQAAGKDIANPFATVLSAEMMLRDFGYEAEADDVKDVVDFCLNNGIATADLETEYSCSCSQVGEIMAALIEEGEHGIKWKKCKEGLSTIV